MNSATVEEGDFPPNPFRSPPPQQQQQQQQYAGQQQDFMFASPATSPNQPDPLNYGVGAPAFAQPPAQAVPVPSGPTNAYAMPPPTAMMNNNNNNVNYANNNNNNMNNNAPVAKEAPAAAAATPSTEPFSFYQGCLSCLNVDTYKSYFDIDTADITKRLKSSLLMFYLPDKFRSEVIGAQRDENHKGPDLYGPLWITFTLVFFVAVRNLTNNLARNKDISHLLTYPSLLFVACPQLTSNLSAYIRAPSRQDFEYDINHMVRALSVLFSFVFVVPAVFWLMTQCLGMQALLLVDWVCLYGYSMVVYIPATLLCLIPLQIFIWVVLAVATAVSALLVVRNVATPLLGADAQANKAGPILIAMLCAHAILFLILKFAFFRS